MSRVDWLLFVVVLVAAAWRGAHFVKASAATGPPGYPDVILEPTIMSACGRGFQMSAERPAALTRFLSGADDRFSCASLPKDLVMRPLPGGSEALYLMLLLAAP